MKHQFLRAVTTLYLLLPSVSFIYGWLKLPLAIPILIVLVGFIVALLIDAFRAFPIRVHDSISGIVLAFVLIVIWMAFSGTGGVGFQNADYRASNALLRDLIVQDWPLTANLAGTQVPVVYYVAYYLPAAVVGKVFGWISANSFLFLWTLVGILLAFAWFWNLSRIDFKNRAIRAGIFLTEIFCLAGGLDYIGGYVLGRNAFDLSAHIEPWARYFEYASNTSLIYWVPQHTIAAWLAIGMIVDALYEKQNLKYLGMAVAAGMIWSPFGILGAAPYVLLILVVYLRPVQRRYIWNWESILFNTLAIGIGAIYLLYLGSNQFKFPIGFLWQFSEHYVELAMQLLAFWCFEFGLLSVLILWLIGSGIFFSDSMNFSTRGWRQWVTVLAKEFRITPIQLCLFLVSLSVLGGLPLFRMGIKNDLVMRGSIASLFIFWAFVAKVIADASLRVRMKFKLLYALISVVLTIGFFTSFNEIARSASLYHLGPPTFSDVFTTGNANETETVMQRLGRKDSLFYRQFSK